MESNIDRDEQAVRQFHALVNMTAAELKEWLLTPESRSVGWKRGNAAAESVGHASGRRILGILERDPDELGPGDYAHMRKVIGFVRRHRAQQPSNVVSSRWRYSLMNWGHDPLRDLDH